MSEAKIAYCRYPGPPQEINLQEWDREIWWRRRFQRKAWIFGGAFCENWISGLAIADVGYLGLAFCYLFNRSTGECVEEKTLLPFAFPSRFSPRWNGAWELKQRARLWSANYSNDEWQFSFVGKQLEVRFAIPHLQSGLTAVAPAMHRPFNATFKLAGVPVQGSARLRGELLPGAFLQGGLDITLGYPGRKIFWNWACLTGKTDEGVIVGINLVSHFNAGLENALWIDGELVPLPEAEFVMGPTRDKDPWHIKTIDGQLEIRFFPEGARKENIWLGLVKSRFVQPFGRFEGTITLPGKPRFAVRGQGVVEEHFALW